MLGEPIKPLLNHVRDDGAFSATIAAAISSSEPPPTLSAVDRVSEEIRCAAAMATTQPFLFSVHAACQAAVMQARQPLLIAFESTHDVNSPTAANLSAIFANLPAADCEGPDFDPKVLAALQAWLEVLYPPAS